VQHQQPATTQPVEHGVIAAAGDESQRRASQLLRENNEVLQASICPRSRGARRMMH